MCLHMHTSALNKFKQHLGDLMQSWCEGNSSARFQEGAELGEQMNWGLVAWLVLRVLVTGSSSLLSFTVFGRGSVWKDGIGCTGTVDLSCIHIKSFV